jgi:hypothetical protein
MREWLAVARNHAGWLAMGSLVVEPRLAHVAAASKSRRPRGRPYRDGRALRFDNRPLHI